MDLELETQIELLRETKRKYECVLQLARAFTNHFYSLVQTQHALGDAFADLSQKSPELQVRPWRRRRALSLGLRCSPSGADRETPTGLGLCSAAGGGSALPVHEEEQEAARDSSAQRRP